MTRLAVVLLLSSGPLFAAGPRPRPQPIMEVKSVEVTNDGLAITVKAEGDTSTAGWTNVQLVFGGLTADSVLYTFQGTPPGGPAAQMVTPVKAQKTLRAYIARGRKQVTVKGATNSQSAPIPSPPKKQGVRPGG